MKYGVFVLPNETIPVCLAESFLVDFQLTLVLKLGLLVLFCLEFQFSIDFSSNSSNSSVSLLFTIGLLSISTVDNFIVSVGLLLTLLGLTLLFPL